MALETVQVRVVDDSVDRNPIEGVVVRIYDSTGTSVITWTTTDANGIADFVVDSDDSPLHARLYKNGVGFFGPVMLDVEDGGTNQFEVEGSLPSLPHAVDPMLCRVSGVLRRGDGTPHPWVDLHFIAQFRPSTVAGDLITQERVAVRSDAHGRVSVDLYRNGIYGLTMEGYEHKLLRVVVPDRPSASIGSVILPDVARVDWDPMPTWTIPAGGSLEVDVTVWTTSMVKMLSAGGTDVDYRVLDEKVAHVRRDGDKITLYGTSPGQTELVVCRTEQAIYHVPQKDIINGRASIIVT